KDENGVYRLSTFGHASVSTMKIVEEAPPVQSRKGNPTIRRLRLITGALLIGLIICASIAVIQLGAVNQVKDQLDTLQSDYDQLLSWTSTTNQAIDFLQHVVQLDTSK